MSRKPTPEKLAKAEAIFARLRALHPDAHCELDHKDAFELLVATVLSAQTTDKLVNKATPSLFARYPNAKTLAAAEPATVAEVLRAGGLGMYNQKGKNIVGLARGLCERHGGEVPRTLAELTALPGVGRKTANVILGVMWGIPDGVVVDTHVQRLSQRLGLTKETTPETIELALCALYPRDHWDPLSHTLIFHGRRVCFAIKPACAGCGAAELCPHAFKADLVGRKPPRAREPAPPKPKASAKKATTSPAKSKASAGATSATARLAAKPKPSPTGTVKRRPPPGRAGGAPRG